MIKKNLAIIITISIICLLLSFYLFVVQSYFEIMNNYSQSTKKIEYSVSIQPEVRIIIRRVTQQITPLIWEFIIITTSLILNTII